MRVQRGLRALHFGVFLFPHDDPLATNASLGLCSGYRVAVQDHLRSDERVYACCDVLGWCPVPPPPERTTYTSMLFQHRVGVWGENATSGEWSQLRDFVYYDPVSVTTLLETSSGYCLTFCDCLDDFVVFATGLRERTARFPKISVACHLLFLLLTLMIGAEMMLDTLDPRVLTCLGHCVDSVASVLISTCP